MKLRSFFLGGGGAVPSPSSVTAYGGASFPLTGEGGTRSVTDEGEAKGPHPFTNLR